MEQKVDRGCNDLIQPNPILICRKESEAVLSLAKNIAQQAINNSLRKKLANQNRVMQDGEESGHSGVANSRGQSSSAATQSSGMLAWNQVPDK